MIGLWRVGSVRLTHGVLRNLVFLCMQRVSYGYCQLYTYSHCSLKACICLRSALLHEPFIMMSCTLCHATLNASPTCEAIIRPACMRCQKRLATACRAMPVSLEGCSWAIDGHLRQRQAETRQRSYRRSSLGLCEEPSWLVIVTSLDGECDTGHAKHNSSIDPVLMAE